MSKIVKSVFSGSEAGSSGASAQAAYNQKAIDELKRQFNITQDNIQPYLDAGTGALANIQDTATPEGMDALIGQIMGTDVYSNLLDERTRAVQGQLAAGGLTRSGAGVEAAANIPTNLALQLESLLTGRQTDISNTGVNAATGLGQIGQANSGTIANLLSGSGSAVANGMVTDAQSKAKGSQNLLNTAATIGSFFFSDPSLKENVETVGTVRDLTLHQWDWKPETKGTIIEGCSNIGFMADEVKDKYPHHVYEFGGVMVIDYPELLNELEAA